MDNARRFSLGFVLLLNLFSCHEGIPYSNDEVIKINAKDEANVITDEKKVETEWKLRVFPEKQNRSRTDPRSIFANRDDMISVDPECDDGKKNLIVDWDESISENYTCSGDIINPDVTIGPKIHGDFIPPAYSAPHFCMDSEIDFYSPLVTFGPHRPLWGRYGEYKFIPRQRWMHNAEHGAVIMLYHPCAHPQQVDQLRRLVSFCLYRHIITPYNLLPVDRPLALVTWGWYLSMNVVRPQLVLRFIQEHALQAPEDLDLDGKYDYALMKPAKIVSDSKDSTLCPSFM